MNRFIISSFLFLSSVHATELSDLGLNNPEPIQKTSEESKETKKIPVAVIDSGIDYNHDNLLPYIYKTEEYNLGFDLNENDHLPYDNHYGYKPKFQEVRIDENKSRWGNFQSLGTSLLNNGLELLKSAMLMGAPGHGTHVSGIVLDSCEEQCGIFPLKVFGKNELKVEHTIKAIKIADQQGIKVVNMSLGYFEDKVKNPELFEEIRKTILDRPHMIFVVAAGNDGDNLSTRKELGKKIYPAMINADHVITVGSIGANGEISSFSNFSDDYVDVYAEGENIMSTWPNNEMKAISGTSMASPKVAGEIALLWNKNATKTAAEISQMYLDSL